MADAVHLGQTADSAALDATTRHRRKHAAQPHTPSSFGQALRHAFQAQAATGRFVSSHVHHAAARVPAGTSTGHAATPPATALHALRQAMQREGVPASWQPGLTYIMAHESGGQVDAKNPVHSARGLFQLTAANYHYNPNGAGSFGDAVQEAQGGIRYIRARYGTADNAVAFWNRNHWY